MPEKLKDEAYIDAPLPISAGQTISQPLTVAFMLDLLQPQLGDRILDVGFGSGWTTALLAEIVLSFVVIPSEARNLKGLQKGKVFAIERIPELFEFGKQNVSKYFPIKGYPSIGSGNDEARVEMKCGDGTKGWPEKAPFDKIIAGASGESLSEAWKEQLKIGGRIVAPVKNSIWLLIKKDKNKFEEIEHPGFVFVPLIEN